MLTAIALTGAQGSGKTSLIDFLLAGLQQAGVQAEVTLNTSENGVETVEVYADPKELSRKKPAYPLTGSVRIMQRRGPRTETLRD